MAEGGRPRLRLRLASRLPGDLAVAPRLVDRDFVRTALRLVELERPPLPDDSVDCVVEVAKHEARQCTYKKKKRH